MKYFVTIGTKEIEVDLDGELATVDGETVRAHLSVVPGTPLRHLRIDSESHELMMERAERGVWRLGVAGASYFAEVVDERTRHIRSLTAEAAAVGGPIHLTAPMPGLVVRVTAIAGQTVQAGQGLIVLEAMKMENELRAMATGVVGALRVAPGQAVKKGQVLIEFAPATAPVPPPLT